MPLHTNPDLMLDGLTASRALDARYPITAVFNDLADKLTACVWVSDTTPGSGQALKMPSGKPLAKRTWLR